MSGKPVHFPDYDEETLEDTDYTHFPPFDIKPPDHKVASAYKRKGTGWIHPNLPAFPLSIMVVGPRKRGKSVVLRNLLDPKKEGSYGHALKTKNVIIYSPNGVLDTTLTSLGFENTYGPKHNCGKIIQDAITSQHNHHLQDNLADVLIVLEDCTVTPDAWEHLRNIGFNGRHIGIHTIAVTHKLTAMDRGIRTQQQQWLLFAPHEESEKESILDAFAGKGKVRRIWRTAIERAWSEKWNFVYIDFERGGDRFQVYRSGFNRPLFTPEEEQLMLQYVATGELIGVKPGDVSLFEGDDAPSDDKPSLSQVGIPISQKNPNVNKKRKRGRPKKVDSSQERIKKKQKQ